MKHLVIGLATAFVALSAAAADKSCDLQSLSFPVEIVDHQAVATVRLNGVPMRLAIDSGAFYSSISDAAAQQLALSLQALPWGYHINGLTGRMDAHLTRVKDVELAPGGTINDVEFIVGGNDLGGRTMGLLGRNLLSAMDTEYDLAHGVVRLLLPKGDCDDRDMAYWAGTTPVSELRLLRDDGSAAPAIRALVKVDGRELVALFDSGASDSALLLRAARELGITDAQLAPGGVVHGIGRGEAKWWTAPVDSVQIGAETIEHNRLDVQDFDHDDFDMLLGFDFFLSHRVYVSKSQRKMFFTYDGGPVFSHNRAAPMAAPAAASGAASDPASAYADEPADAAAFARRGTARAARRDVAGALADLDRACALAPEVGAYRRLRGDVESRDGQAETAAHDYDEAIRLDPSDADARARRARLRQGAGDRDGALADLQAMDAQLPPQAGLRRTMALLYAQLDQPARALAQWTAWIAAHPHDVGLPLALYGRGLARLRLGDDTAGRADIAAARDGKPDIDAEARRVGLPAAP